MTARRLGVIGLALVLISAMDSIRNLPTTATFGWSAIFFYGITVLVFLATTAAYVINPDLSQNKAFLVPVMLVIFWAVTLSSLFGCSPSSSGSSPPATCR